MSLRVVCYRDGKRIVVIEEPARARVGGQVPHHALTLIGGWAIDTESERARQLRMQREAMRKARAK